MMPQVFDDDPVLASEMLVRGAPRDVRHFAELVDSGLVDALFAKQALRCVKDALARA
jgi:hypothetical protein